jgi:sec-independent protein translocase protein TatA
MIQFLLNGYAILSEQMIIIIGVVALVLFGGAKIPQLMRGLGRGMGEFHAGVAEGKTIMQSTLKADATKEVEPVEEPKH